MVVRSSVVVVVTLCSVTSAPSARQGADASYLSVGDARVNGLAIRPFSHRFKVSTVPYSPAPDDTVEERGIGEDRVDVITRGRREALLQTTTWPDPEGTEVDSILVDRRTLALISSKSYDFFGNTYFIAFRVRGRHVRFISRRRPPGGPDTTLASLDSTLTEQVFPRGCEQLLIYAIAPLLREGAMFRIPLVGEDPRIPALVVDTMDVRVTGSERYPWPGSDSTDVWVVRVGGDEFRVAKRSGRILEQRGGLGDDPRYMRAVAMP